MRRLLLLVLLFSPFLAEVCVAQGNHLNIVCKDCRDPHDYPDDFANFAFNQIYGPDAWLSFDQADDFFVTNLSNQRVYVDADYIFFGIGFEGFRVAFWPKNLMQFTLALPDGTVLQTIRSIYQTSLPVPSSHDAQPSHPDSGGSSFGGDEEEDGDDEYDDADDHEWEEPEYDGYEGTTRIEDPDEDGNFDDAEWCEEC